MGNINDNYETMVNNCNAEEKKKVVNIIKIQRYVRRFLRIKRYSKILMKNYREKKAKKMNEQNSIQFKPSWDMFFQFRYKYEFTHGGLQKLRKDIDINYERIFESFDVNIEIEEEMHYTSEDLDEIITSDDFLSKFRQYVLISLSQNFKIDCLFSNKNNQIRYCFDKFKFEEEFKSLDFHNDDPVFDRGIITFDNLEINKEQNDNRISLVELINDEKRYIYEEILSELEDVEKTCCIESNQDTKTKVYFQGNVSQEDGVKSGLGKEYFMDNTAENRKYKYCGYYQNNKYHGIGILINDNGDCYFGEFRNGLKNGFGYLVTKDCKVKGFFKDGKLEGYAEYKSQKFHYYGNFHQDLFDGIGLLVKYKDNKEYPMDDKDNETEKCKIKCLGMFSKGKVNGVALYKFSNGDTYYGEWTNELMDGLGIYYYKRSKDIYQGYYEKNLKKKGGYFFVESQSKITGSWINGKKDGKFILYIDIGYSNDNNKDPKKVKKLEITYKNDERID